MRDSVRARLIRLALYVVPAIAVGAAALLYFGGGDAASTGQTGSVQVVGSETMRPVMTACAEEFMTRHPNADIIVKGGGSGDGIAAILHGIADIGMTSREVSRRERDYAAARSIELGVVDLARDGVAVIAHPANGVAALDFAQLRDVFTGKIRNWRDLGGADREIFTYARAAGSGTAALFGDRVLGEESYHSSVQRLPTNESIVAAVTARPGALGYTGFAALRATGDTVKTIPLHAEPSAAPVLPSAETVRQGTYPLARTLHLAVAGKPAGAVKAFVDFCTGTNGNALLQRAGYLGNAAR